MPSAGCGIRSKRRGLARRSAGRILAPRRCRSISGPVKAVLSVFLFILSLNNIISLICPFLAFGLSSCDNSLVLTLNSVFTTLLCINVYNCAICSFIGHGPGTIFLNGTYVVCSFMAGLFVFIMKVFGRFSRAKFCSSMELNSSLV